MKNKPSKVINNNKTKFYNRNGATAITVLYEL